MRALIPRRHFTTYERDGLRYFHTWRQFRGRVFAETWFPVGTALN